jgi:hypothetical protein
MPRREPPWHALLAPLPVEMIPRRRLVGSPEILATPAGAAIAGWEQLTIELSAGAAGLRHVLVVLDGTGQPISASDAVLYRSEVTRDGDADADALIEYRHESIGGRLEPDGAFAGTRWRSVAVASVDEDEPQFQSTSASPSTAEVTGLKALVEDMLRRRPPVVEEGDR